MSNCAVLRWSNGGNAELHPKKRLPYDTATQQNNSMCCKTTPDSQIRKLYMNIQYTYVYTIPSLTAVAFRSAQEVFSWLSELAVMASWSCFVVYLGPSLASPYNYVHRIRALAIMALTFHWGRHTGAGIRGSCSLPPFVPINYNWE